MVITNEIVRRKIEIAQLELGMYICDIDRPWSETNFLFQGFPLLSDEDIELVQKNCQFVFIDESRRVHIQLKRQHTPLFSSKQPETRRPKPLSAEVQAARAIHSSGTQLINSLFEDIQFGHGVDTKACRSFVRECVDSVLRNESALLWLTRLKSKDDYTGQHCLSVAVLAIGFARHLGFSGNALELIGLSGLLHDVGKISVDPAILNKPGQLDEHEFATMRSHAEKGYALLQEQGELDRGVLDVVHNHHERPDGQGYPQGLADEHISLHTKIVSICDVYDAITSHRVYDGARPPKAAFKALMQGRETQFDPRLVIRFIEWLGIFPVGTLVQMHTGEVGVVLETHASLRLRPRVVLLRDEGKAVCPPRYLDLAQVCTDAFGTPYRICDSLPDGSYGIHLADPDIQAVLNTDALKIIEQVLEPDTTTSARQSPTF